MKQQSKFNDKRSGKIALIAHCILNQNSRVPGLAERPSAIKEIITLLMDKEIGIAQMPCPELGFAGIRRPPQTREEYDSVIYRRYCEKIAKELANQIEEYEKAGIRLQLVVGVKGSPSCGINETLGIFMKELRFALGKKKISAPFYSVGYKSIKHDITELKKLIK